MMLKLLWNSFKASPALLGISLLMASGAHAAQSIEQASLPDQAASATPNQAIAAVELAKDTTVPQLSLSSDRSTVSLKDSPQIEPPQTAAENPTVTQLTDSTISPTLKLADTTLAQQTPATETTTPNSTNDVLQQINRYTNDGSDTSQDQVTNVSQLRDVSPGDWAYEALRSLVERYGCIAGYPDGTFKGRQATTRYEFAAGLNACLNQVERLITSSTEGFVRRQDLETLQRLVNEFRTELTTLGARVDKLEGRVAFLETNQFSTTTKLNAQVLFFVANAFGDSQAVPSGFAPAGDLRSNTTFTDRIRLNLDTSFTGKDLLRTRLQARNFEGFTDVAGTQMAEFGQQGNEGNQVRVSKLLYQRPLGNQLIVYGGSAFELDDVVPNLFAGPVFGEFLSDFLSNIPIYKMGGGAGGGIAFGVNSPIRIDALYAAGGDSSPNDPTEGSGLFNGSYSALGQITFQPTPAIQIAASYLHAYGNSPAGFDGSFYGNTPFGVLTRSIDPDGNPLLVGGSPVFGGLAPGSSGVRTTTTNAYNLSANFRLGSSITIGATGGYSTAADETDLGAGVRKLWTYAAALGFSDIGGPGNVLGLGFGMPPRSRTGRTDRPGDRDTTYQAEAFYRFKVNDNIAITPGVFILFNPEHNKANSDIYIGAIRTEFLF